MLPDKIVKKVPGETPISSQSKQGYISDITRLAVPALAEILDRQDKLLADRAFIQKLPDRGERIKNFKEQLLHEIKKRDELADVCHVMSGLTVNGKELSDNLEWHIRGSKASESTSFNHDEEQHSSDSDDTNPLKILASHSGAGFHKKIIRQTIEPQPLIKPSDLITDDNKSEFPNEPYVEALCSKFDSNQTQERFLPFKTLITEKALKNNKVRDITAATPPVSKLNHVKQVTLQESLALQFEQAHHLREVQLRHAAERLREKGSVLIGDVLPPPETTSHYRESPPSDSEEEILDEEAKEETGGVTFPLANS